MSEKIPTKIEVTSGDSSESEYPPFAGDFAPVELQKPKEVTKLDLLEARGFGDNISVAEGKRVTAEMLKRGVEDLVDMFEEDSEKGRQILILNPGGEDRVEGSVLEGVVASVARREEEVKKAGQDKTYALAETSLFILPPEEFENEDIDGFAQEMLGENVRVIGLTEKIHDEEGDLRTVDLASRMRKSMPALADKMEFIAIVADGDVVENGLNTEGADGTPIAVPVRALHRIAS